MRYRIEIYTPSHKREHGYYVLPFLIGETIVARVDLKSDRARGTLRVQAAHLEAGADRQPAAQALAGELSTMAGWLGLSDGVIVAKDGGFDADLKQALERD